MVAGVHQDRGSAVTVRSEELGRECQGGNGRAAPAGRPTSIMIPHALSISRTVGVDCMPIYFYAEIDDLISLILKMCLTFIISLTPSFLAGYNHCTYIRNATDLSHIVSIRLLSQTYLQIFCVFSLSFSCFFNGTCTLRRPHQLSQGGCVGK